jgi:hypothetical protein
VKPRVSCAALINQQPKEKGSVMKRRLSTLLAIGFLTIGTGGTLALAGGGNGTGGSASFHQYKPPCPNGSIAGKHCGKGEEGKGQKGH